MTPQRAPVRDAATVILLRDRFDDPHVLMGQRAAAAAFMPMKFVFPGGAVDPQDAQVPLATGLNATCAARLRDTSTIPPESIAAAAIRELWEETGQILGQPDQWPTPPHDWHSFAATGHRPAAAPLQFIFRAITPVGNKRRFDARFFLAEAEALASDPDDFSRATDELNQLQWVPLARARALDLPFITAVVLAELAARLHDPAPPTSVPFFRNDDEAHLVARLGGRNPLET